MDARRTEEDRVARRIRARQEGEEKRKARAQARKNADWYKESLPEEAGRFNDKEKLHLYDQVIKKLMWVLMNSKKCRLDFCATILLQWINHNTLGQYFGTPGGMRLFWKLPPNAELGEMLDFSIDRVSKGISRLRKINLIIVKGNYHNRWACIHPGFYGITREDLIGWGINWDEIVPDYQWWVNLGSKKTKDRKIWHSDTEEKDLDDVDLDQSLAKVIRYAEKIGKGVGFKCSTPDHYDTMMSGLRDIEKFYKEIFPDVHKILNAYDPDKHGSLDKDMQKLYDRLAKIKEPADLFCFLIHWLVEWQKENPWYKKIHPGTFKGGGKPLRELCEAMLQGLLGSMLYAQGNRSEILMAVLKKDEKWLKAKGYRPHLRRALNGSMMAITKRPVSLFGREAKK
jgi:hypothetical protein